MYDRIIKYINDVIKNNIQILWVIDNNYFIGHCSDVALYYSM